MRCTSVRLGACALSGLMCLFACSQNQEDIDLLGQPSSRGMADSHISSALPMMDGLEDMYSPPDALVASPGDLGVGEGGQAEIELIVYSLGINFVELGDYLLPLQLEAVPVHDDGGLVGYDRLSLRAVKDGDTSAIFAEVVDVEVVNGDRFVADFAESTLPMDFSPTGSEVSFTLRLEGTVRVDGTICGTVSGEITTIGTVLAMSTFGSIPWVSGGASPPGGCGMSDDVHACPRLTEDTCPEFSPGLNVLNSCGLERNVTIFVPDGFTGESLPVLFLWHGLTDTSDSLLERNLLAQEVTPRDFILMAPESRQLPVAWQQLNTRDNPDLALFDDLITCGQARFNIDRERVYNAGLSAGGLWTTYLSLMRSHVVAAAAALSGGLIIDYVPPVRPTPFLVSWGGPDDVSHGQNFETFSQNLIGDLRSGAHPVVACNHGGGHEWMPQFNPWILDFLFAHTLSGGEMPYAMGLTDVFPDYCEVPVP